MTHLHQECSEQLECFAASRFFLYSGLPLKAVLAYCMYIHGLGLAPYVMGNRLAAIAFYSKSAGFTDPCMDFRVRKALEGWAQCGVRGKDARLPFLPIMLQQLVEVLPVICLSLYEVLLFKAVYFCRPYSGHSG